MHLRGDFGFEDEGDIVVVGMDMPDGQQSSASGGILTWHIQSETP